MKRWLLGLFALPSVPAFAQEAVPAIAFNSVSDPGDAGLKGESCVD